MYESIRWHARVQSRTRMPFEHTLPSIEFSNSLVFKPSYILTDVNGGAATVWYPPPVSTGTRKSAGPDPRHAREGGHAQMHPNNPRPSSLRTPEGVRRPGLDQDKHVREHRWDPSGPTGCGPRTTERLSLLAGASDSTMPYTHENMRSRLPPHVR
jgi:hypothetical protein